MVASLPAWSQKLINFSVALLIILLCIAGISSLQLPQLQKLQAQDQNPNIEQIRRDVETERLRLAFLKNMPTFGFDNLIANWTFLNFLQYFGDTPARQQTDYQLSPDYFEVILKRDPYFIAAYSFLSTSASIYAGQPERSVSLIASAVKSLKPNIPPNSYIVWRQLGIDQLLFLGDAAAARQSFLTAAQWAAQSTEPGSQDVARLSQQTADFLAANPNSKIAQFAAWSMVLSNAPDDRTRQLAAQRIEAVGGKITRQPDGSFSLQPPTQD